MMNLENIKKELAARGIEADQVEVVKNGVSCVGFRIVTGTSIAPIVYYSQQETLENFMLRINEALSHTLDFNIEELLKPAYILQNLYVSVQRFSEEEDLVKKKVLNIEAYLRIYVDFSEKEENGSIKVSKDLLRMSGLSEEKVWDQANKNMASAFRVRSMAAVLGMPEELFPAPFYVVTTQNGIDGASALLYPEIFKNFCKEYGIGSVVILPSSTQEVLIIPEDDSMCYADFADMVNEVNNTEVDPKIQLDPVVYRYDLESDEIQIVAVAEE